MNKSNSSILTHVLASPHLNRSARPVSTQTRLKSSACALTAHGLRVYPRVKTATPLPPGLFHKYSAAVPRSPPSETDEPSVGKTLLEPTITVTRKDRADSLLSKTTNLSRGNLAAQRYLGCSKSGSVAEKKGRPGKKAETSQNCEKETSVRFRLGKTMNLQSSELLEKQRQSIMLCDLLTSLKAHKKGGCVTTDKKGGFSQAKMLSLSGSDLGTEEKLRSPFSQDPAQIYQHGLYKADPVYANEFYQRRRSLRDELSAAIRPFLGRDDGPIFDLLEDSRGEILRHPDWFSGPEAQMQQYLVIGKIEEMWMRQFEGAARSLLEAELVRVRNAIRLKKAEREDAYRFARKSSA